MKSRALYHLMMLAGRSVVELVAPELRGRVDAACDGLIVRRIGPGSLEVAWPELGVERVIEVEGRRFAFYLRGDVPALVARRPDELDARRANWVEAHRLWEELLGVTGLAEAAASGPSAPTLHRNLEAARSRRPAALGAAGVAVVVAGVGVARATHPTADLLIPGLAGLGLTSAVSLASARGSHGPETRCRSVALSAVIAGAAPICSPVWWAAAGLLGSADAVALGLQRDAGRAGRAFGIVGVGVAGAVAVHSVGRTRFAGSSAVPQVAARMARSATVAVAVALAGDVVGHTTVGTRDRLSPWLWPGAVGLVAVVDRRERATATWATAVLAGLVGWRASTRRQKRGRTAISTANPATDAAPASTPVTISRRA